MQLEAFLRRIGFSGSPAPTLETLERLIRCHLETVPFENLDFYHRPGILSLKVEDLYRKIVSCRRGGVCFELNGLMYWALGEMGFARYPVSVRILDPDSVMEPVTHQGNIVLLEGQKYYCDVGYGGPGPQGVLCLDSPGIQLIAGEPFRVRKEGPQYRILRQNGQDWYTLFLFADVPSCLEDFEMLLYYFTTHPQSYFLQQRIVNLTCPDGSLSLTGNTFTRRKNGQVIRRQLTGEEECSQILQREFGLDLGRKTQACP